MRTLIQAFQIKDHEDATAIPAEKDIGLASLFERVARNIPIQPEWY